MVGDWGRKPGDNVSAILIFFRERYIIQCTSTVQYSDDFRCLGLEFVVCGVCSYSVFPLNLDLLTNFHILLRWRGKRRGCGSCRTNLAYAQVYSDKTEKIWLSSRRRRHRAFFHELQSRIPPRNGTPGQYFETPFSQTRCSPVTTGDMLVGRRRELLICPFIFSSVVR